MRGNTLHVIVIGAGPGGYTAAFEAAKRGGSVTIIERDHPGGTCLQHGCIPVETLARAAEVYSTIQNAARYGVTCSELTIDFSRIIDRKNAIVKANEDGLIRQFRSLGIERITGIAKIVSSNAVEVDGNILETDRIVCAHGGRPLDIPGIIVNQKNILNYEGALKATILPMSVVIIGGGVIGCEFASLYRGFGVEVSIVEKDNIVLPMWDNDVATEVSRSLKRRGVDIHTGITVTDVKSSNAGAGVLVTSKDGIISEADVCLVAPGRAPAVENTGALEIGMAVDPHSGGIAVNEWQETSVPGIYAVGDVTGRAMLAHAAEAEAEVAVRHMFGEDTQPVDYRSIPDTCRIMPAAASVGLTGRDVESAKPGTYKEMTVPFRTNSAAHAYGDPGGFVKAIAKTDSGIVGGVQIVGSHAAELIGECAVIVRNRLTVHEAANTVHAHPAMSETVRATMKELAGRLR